MKRKTPGRELTWVGGSAKEPVLEASKMLPKSGDSAISRLKTRDMINMKVNINKRPSPMPLMPAPLTEDDLTGTCLRRMVWEVWSPKGAGMSAQRLPKWEAARRSRVHFDARLCASRKGVACCSVLLSDPCGFTSLLSRHTQKILFFCRLEPSRQAGVALADVTVLLLRSTSMKLLFSVELKGWFLSATEYSSATYL
jgi:hypothetical protein